MKYTAVGQPQPTSNNTSYWFSSLFFLLCFIGTLGFLLYWVSLPSPVSVPDAPVIFQLRLQGNLSTITNQTLFSIELRKTIAAELGISINQIVVLKLESGSVLVTVRILGASATLLSQRFLAKIANSSDLVHNKTLFQQYPIIYTPPPPEPPPLNVTFIPRVELERDYATWTGIIAKQFVNKSEMPPPMDLGAIDTTVNISTNSDTAALVVTAGWLELANNPPATGTGVGSDAIDNMLLIDPITHIVKEGKAPSTSYKASYATGSDGFYVNPIANYIQPVSMYYAYYDPFYTSNDGQYLVHASGIYLINYSVRIPSTTGVWHYDFFFKSGSRTVAKNSFYHSVCNTTGTIYNTFEMNRQVTLYKDETFWVGVTSYGAVGSHVTIVAQDEVLQLHILSTIDPAEIYDAFGNY